MKILVDPRLWGNPKLLRFAQLLGRNPTEASGYLVRLWAWAVEYRPSGSLAGLEDRETSSAGGWLGDSKKFCHALRASGWVKDAQIHGWQEHQGKYIERIIAERARKRRGTSAEPPRNISPSVPLPVPVPVTAAPLEDSGGVSPPPGSIISDGPEAVLWHHWNDNRSGSPISRAKGEQHIRVALARGAKANAIDAAFMDAAKCAGKKIWEVLEALSPAPPKIDRAREMILEMDRREKGGKT